jgi:plastocyanin
MGILVAWFAPNQTKGIDPFAIKPADMLVRYTHGHLKENNNHGGQIDPTLPDPAALANGPLVNDIEIDYYDFTPGNLALATEIPTVHQGQSIRFTNTDAPASGYGVWHSITSCALPCNRTTGVAYPTADATIEFDSGQLGNAGPPTAGRLAWDTPTDLPPGTYAFWCRVHPFMRGAFRVVP